MKKIMIIFSSFFTLIALWASSLADNISNVTVYYKCYLNGKYPASSYCTLKKVIHKGSLHNSNIVGVTHFNFGEFVAGVVSAHPYALYGQRPSNIEDYPFDKNNYSFMVKISHANLTKGTYDNRDYYMPTFVLPVGLAKGVAYITTCKIIGKTKPKNIAQVPLTLIATTYDQIVCDR